MDSLPEWNVPKWDDKERGARIDAAMARYLTPAQIRRLGELFAECAVAMVEGRTAREAREAAAIAEDAETER